MTAFRHVIFDLDGTLVDSLPGIAYSVDAALTACGFTASDCDLAPLIGPPVRDILETVSHTHDRAVLQRLESSFRASYDAEGWRRTKCLAGVPDMLWNLMTSGCELRIATNKPSIPTGRILRELRLAAFFRQVICRDSRVPPFSSKAEMLSDLIARHGMDRQDCLMVGDTSEDWRAAEAAGIACAIAGQTFASWNELEAMVRKEEVAV